MKAIVYDKYGSPDDLQMKEIEKPIPKENEVLIKVHAASVNSWDWDLLRGKPLLTRLDGILKPKYKILGDDIAGRVEDVGRSAHQFQLGDAVFGDISGCSWGGFAEYVCVPEHVLAMNSSSMTFEQAAATPHATGLALQGLRYKGQLQPGKRVLINGASGGVGTFAVQIAKSFGAEVTVVCSTKKMDLVRSIGADHVIDYTQEDFTKNGQRYDLILDVMAKRSMLYYKRALSPKGIYVMVGGKMARIFQLIFLGPWISKTTNKKMGILIYKPNTKDLDFVNELFNAGKVKPIIDRHYPLREVPEALRYLGNGNAHGKVVITVKEPS